MVQESIFGRLSSAIFNAVHRHLDIVGRQFNGADNFRQSASGQRAEAEALYLQARYAMRAGKVEESLPLYARAVSLAPDLGDATEGYGEAADQLNQRALAVEKYEASRRLRMGNNRAAPDRAFVHRRAGRIATEIANYTWQLQSRRNSVFLYIARGNAHLALGKPENALDDYNAALGISRDLPQAMSLKGESYLMLGDYDAAAKSFDEALGHDPASADALSGRAIAHLARGRLGDANVDWRRQLSVLRPSDAAARACVALRLTEYALARQELDRALVQQPEDLRWRLYRMTAARRIGEAYVPGAPVTADVWPGPLLEYLAGRMSAAEVLHLANDGERQVDAHFQFGVSSLTERPEDARRHFEYVVEHSSPGLIEHAAARHELMRWSL